MSEEIRETPSTTPNFQTELAAQLAELMPDEGEIHGLVALMEIQSSRERARSSARSGSAR